MKRVLIASIAALALAFGFVLGRASAPHPELPTADTPEPTDRTVVQRVEVAAGTDCEDELAALQQRLELAEGIIDAQITAQVGTPQPFPDELEPQYREDGFEAAVLEALEDCPEAGIELAFVDCAEFPCMAFFSQPSGRYNHGVATLRNCESWRASFDGGGQANGNFMTDKGVMEYSLASPRPSGTRWDDDAGARWTYRMEEGKRRLMDLWGGREFTELEKIDRSIDFWLDVEASRPEDEKGQLEEIFEDLEAQRATLLAEGAE